MCFSLLCTWTRAGLLYCSTPSLTYTDVYCHAYLGHKNVSPWRTRRRGFKPASQLVARPAIQPLWPNRPSHKVTAKLVTASRREYNLCLFLRPLATRKSEFVIILLLSLLTRWQFWCCWRKASVLEFQYRKLWGPCSSRLHNCQQIAARSRPGSMLALVASQGLQKQLWTRL